MRETSSISSKVKEIIAEMKRQGLWKEETPAWVTDYEKSEMSYQKDFAGWLQFVFLPNRLLKEQHSAVQVSNNYVVLQARNFFRNDLRKGKLLQLLVELDALS